jgi:hypothetical protein
MSTAIERTTLNIPPSDILGVDQILSGFVPLTGIRK